MSMRIWPQDGPRMAPRWPRMAQDGPRMAQDGPRMAQDGPKMAPRWPRMAQDGPRMAQDGPKMAHDGPSWGCLGLILGHLGAILGPGTPQGPTQDPQGPTQDPSRPPVFNPQSPRPKLQAGPAECAERLNNVTTRRSNARHSHTNSKLRSSRSHPSINDCWSRPCCSSNGDVIWRARLRISRRLL